MIKKTLIFALCLILFILSVPVVYAQEPTVTFTLDKKETGINQKLTLTITVSEPVTSFSAYAYTQGNMYFFSGAEYDMDTGYYLVTFGGLKQTYDIVLYTTYMGDDEVCFENIQYTTQSGSYQIDSAKVNVRIRPEYTPIYTKEDLNNIRNNLSGNYILMNDIVFEEADFAEGGAFYNGGNGWIPIGAMPSCSFTGVLYGNGYAIKGLKINRAYYFYNGLFGVSVGEIEALVMQDTYINLTQGINTGVLAQTPDEQTEGEKVNSNAKLSYGDKEAWTDPSASADESTLNKYDRTGESNAVGGFICGANYGTIRESYAQGTAVGNKYVGGFAASNSGTIKNCISDVDILGAQYAGGITARATVNSKIYDSLAMGSMVATNKAALAYEAKGTISRTYTLFENEDVYLIGTAVLTEVYAVNEREAKEIRFTDGDWDYTRKIPCPSALAYLINEEAVFGDVNGDGGCDITDLAELKLLLAGAIDQTSPAIVNPDVNSDAEVDVEDLAVLKLFLSGATV